MKRLLCLLLCLAMVLSMAACGKATPVPSEKEPTSSQPADPAPEAQPAPETEPENPDNAYIDEMAAKPAPSGAVGYIDISINPLVRLYFDVNDVIIEVRYLNGGAKDAFEEKVEEHKVEGMDLEKGIRILTETAIEKGYLKEGAPVTVGVEIIEEEAAVKADLEKLAEATVLAVVESEEVTAVVTVAESAEEVVQKHKENNKKNDGNNGNHNGQITPDDAPNSSQQGNGQTPGVGEQTNTGAPGNSGGNNNAGGNSGNNGNNGNNRPSVDDDEDEDDDDGGNSWFPGIGDDDEDEDDTPSGGSGSEEETAPVITLFRKGKELAAGHTFNTIDSMQMEVHADSEKVTDFTVSVAAPAQLAASPEDGDLVVTPLKVGKTTFTVSYNGKTSRIFIEVLLDGEAPGAEGLSIACHDGEMGDGTEFATLEQTEDLTVYYGGEPCTDFTCESENDAILIVKNVDGKLRLTPVADGWVGFSVTSADETLYIRLAVGTGGTGNDPAATKVGILWNGQSEGNGFFINRLLQEVSTDVLVNGSPVGNFTCESENKDILTAENDNGKLKLTPTGDRFGTVGFTVSYNGETAIFKGSFHVEQ